MIELEDRLTRYEDLSEEQNTFDAKKSIKVQYLLVGLFFSWLLCLVLFITVDCLKYAPRDGPLCAIHSSHIETSTVVCALLYLIILSLALTVHSKIPMYGVVLVVYTTLFDFSVIDGVGHGIASLASVLIWMVCCSYSIHKEVQKRLFTRGRRTKISLGLKICTVLYCWNLVAFIVLLFVKPDYMYIPLGILLVFIAIYILCLVAYIRKVSFLIFNRK